MRQARTALLPLLALLFLWSAGSSAVSSDLSGQIRSFAPPGVVSFLKRPEDLQIHTLAADLDDTGRYDYLVVAYVAPISGGKVRVLRNVDGRLHLAGVLDPGDELEVDGNVLMSLEYLDDSGVPAIKVEAVSADGQNATVSFFRWTGTRIVSMLPRGTHLVNAYLADPEGDGVLDIVNPPSCDRSGECVGSYERYGLRKGMYSLTGTSAADPSGLTPPPGQHLPLPGRVTLQPEAFTASEIVPGSAGARRGGDVVLRLGNLAGVEEPEEGSDVSEIDLDSIRLGRSLRPLEVRIVGARSEEGFRGSFLEVVLPRPALLKALKEAQPSGPPRPGDVLTLQVSARMKNGLALYGFVPVRLVR